jgi:L-threonylcarbamoyladenylate synthase
MAAPTIALRDGDADLDPLVEALEAGGLAVIPTDTVYGLACAARLQEACERVARVKGRTAAQPSALLCGSLAAAVEAVLAGLPAAAVEQARRLLPGPVTVVVPNPQRRFPWLCGATPERIGLRVPELEPRLAAALDRVGGVLATSANLHGGPDPPRLEDVPGELLEAAAVLVDGGPTRHRGASTVVDLSGAAPVVLREGVLGSAQALAALAAPDVV